MKIGNSDFEQPDINQLTDYYSWYQSSKLNLQGYADYAATPDILIAVSKVFFPDFIECKRAIILGWRFSQKNFDLWYSHFQGNIREIEVILNTVDILEELFPNAMEKQSYHNVEYLGRKIAFAWECELKKQFPEKQFKVMGEKHPLREDFSITFWQV